jgi:hypothetical protein
MKRLVMVVVSLVGLAALACAQSSPASDATRDWERTRSEYSAVLALDGVAKDEILAIARLLRARPEMAIDRTRESGEYCLKSSESTMTHYAKDPAATKEDIVYEFAATPLLKAGLDPMRLPPLPVLGKMEPGQWYYLPEGQVDPHHQHKMSGPTLLVAVDVR